MAMNAFGVGFVLNAVDKATPALKSVQGAFSSLFSTASKGMGELGKSIAIGAMGAGARKYGKGLLGMVDEAAAAAGPVNKAIRYVKAVRGETAGMAEEARAAIRSGGIAQLGLSADEAAGAFQSMAMGGNSAAASAKNLQVAMNLSKIAMISGAESGEALDDMFDVFGGTLDQSKERVDKIAWAMRQYGVSGQQVMQMLRATAPSAQLVNASFEDMLQATGMVASVIPNSARAAASVQQAFMQLASEQTQKKLKGMGIAVQDEQGKFLGLDKVLGKLVAKTNEMNEAEKATTIRTLFGGRAAGGMAVIFDKLTKGVKGANGELLYGSDAMEYLTNSMNSSTGMAEKMAKEMTSAGDIAKAQAERARDAFGDAALDFMKPFKKIKAALWGGFADLLEGLPPEAKKAIVGITSALGGLLAMTGTVIIASSALKMFGLSLGSLALTALKTLLVLGPLALLLGGVGFALYGAFTAIEKRGKNSVGIMEKLSVGWKGMVELVSSRSLSKETQKALENPEMAGVKGFLDWIDGMLVKWDAFWVGIKAGWERGLGDLMPKVDEFIARFETLSLIFSDETKPGLDGITQAGERAGESLAGLAGLGLDMLGSLVDVVGQVGEKLQGLTAKDVVNGITGVVNAFRTMWNVLSSISEVLSIIWRVIMTITRALSTGVTAIAETAGNIVDTIQGDIAAATGDTAKARGYYEHRGYAATAELAGQTRDIARGYTDEEAAAQQRRDQKVADQLQLNAYRRQYAELMAQGKNDLPVLQGLSEGKLTGMSKDQMRDYNARVIKGLDELATSINRLAGKELVARVEYEALGKAMNRAIGDEDGRSLAPAIGAGY